MVTGNLLTETGFESISQSSCIAFNQLGPVFNRTVRLPVAWRTLFSKSFALPSLEGAIQEADQGGLAVGADVCPLVSGSL